MSAGGRQAGDYPGPLHAAMITLACLLSATIVMLDSTITVIAMPRIQSSLSASQEQIAWTLTSYLIAQAVSTPLSGWLADRFGRKRVLGVGVAGFTLASIGCGAAPNLELLVVFRFIQGFAGAGAVPLTQVLMLDTYPPEKQSKAIALFGMGTLVGPMLGPTLGAWLTESFSWRWIFLINLPFGLVALALLVLFVRDDRRDTVRGFDLAGFVAVSVALAALQLMLDRGQLLDWFASPEIWIEATVAGLAGWTALVHMSTTAHPFINPATFADRNFSTGSILSALSGVLMIGVVPLMAAIMQQLLGYPVMLAGMLALPRAIGNVIGIWIAGRYVMRVGPRRMICGALAMLVGSIWLLTGLSLDARQSSFALSSLLTGLGSGFLFLPLTMAVFSTLPSHLRNEASALFALVRSLGGSIGLSVMQAMTIRDMATTQSRLVEHVRPDNPVVALWMPGMDFTNAARLAALAGQVTRQAAMVAYVDTFRVVLVLAVVMAPLCLLIRNPDRRGVTVPPPAMAME